MSTTTGLSEATQFGGDDEADDLEATIASSDPEVDPDIEPDEADEADDDDRPNHARRTRSAARRRSADKSLIRRAAMKVIELSNADPRDRGLLADVLGVDDDPVPLTVAVLSADRSALNGIQELFEIADTSPVERGVVLMSIGRAKMRASWQMYSDLGVDAG